MIKIAFLFLTISTAHHEQLWRDFFAGHDEQYSIYVHAKNEIPATSLLHPYRIAETVPTTWANTMRAQVALLKEALKDPANQKFMFASESTIPLATFDTVFQHVTKTPHSLFMYRLNPHLIPNTPAFNPARNLEPIPPHMQYKNYQWVVLNRKHAQLMVDDTYYITITENYPSDQEHYPSTLLAAHGLLHEVEQKSTTYIYWPPSPPTKAAHPYSFTNFQDPMQFSLAHQALRKGYHFIRKIDKDCIMEPLINILPYCNNKER